MEYKWNIWRSLPKTLQPCFWINQGFKKGCKRLYESKNMIKILTLMCLIILLKRGVFIKLKDQTCCCCWAQLPKNNLPVEELAKPLSKLVRPF
jgi:hypothetical protein